MSIIRQKYFNFEDNGLLSSYLKWQWSKGFEIWDF